MFNKIFDVFGSKETKKKEEIEIVSTSKVLVMKTYDTKWPRQGHFKCWGEGLLWGEGNEKLLDWNSTSEWQVIEIEESKSINFPGDRITFTEGVVLLTSSREQVTDYIYNNSSGKAIHGLNMRVENNGVLIGGCNSFLSGNKHCILTAGNNSGISGGDYSIITGGKYSRLSGGKYSTLIAEDCSKLFADDNSSLKGGIHCTLCAGDNSTLISGDYSTLRSKISSKLSGGYGSEFVVKYWDDRVHDWRSVMATVGYGGIFPNKLYKIEKVEDKYGELTYELTLAE